MPWLQETSPRLALAFNRGCDDRLAGKSLHDCPYQDYMECQNWGDGWRHVDKGWGSYVSGRWPVASLPPAYITFSGSGL